VSRSISPKIIGAFVTASIAIFVMLILFFGSAKLFSQSIRYILFFEHSVNGLDVGSPVKFKGVPVGVVERILIRVEGQSKDSTSIPVIVKIDRSRLTNRLGTSVEVFDPVFIHEMIESGLVAQLNVESFITGQLFVEFSLQPEQVENFAKHRDSEYGMVEIPTLGSPFGEITDDVGNVISSFAEIDFYKTSKTINLVLENLVLVLQELDVEELSRSIIGAADQLTLLLKSGELQATLSSMRSALAQIEKTASTYDLEKGQLAETIIQLNQTLDGLNRLVAGGNALIAPESDIRYGLQSSLRELSQAAKSLRIFINYLERNPNALLTGRPEESQ
jgi:paraquat-inducible protein B